MEFENLSAVEAAIGQKIGTSPWVEITQEMVNQFAEATKDHQWIHVDVERAKRESPFGGPIAHGFLTLSLASYFISHVMSVQTAKMGGELWIEQSPFSFSGRSRKSGSYACETPLFPALWRYRQT